MLSLVRSNLYACTCNIDVSFTEIISKAHAFAVVKLIKDALFDLIYNKHIPMLMEVEVVEVLKGAETHK